jgi:hypothetical protein
MRLHVEWTKSSENFVEAGKLLIYSCRKNYTQLGLLHLYFRFKQIVIQYQQNVSQ